MHRSGPGPRRRAEHALADGAGLRVDVSLLLGEWRRRPSPNEPFDPRAERTPLGFRIRPADHSPTRSLAGSD